MANKPDRRPADRDRHASGAERPRSTPGSDPARSGSGDDNLSVRTDVDKSGIERPAGAAVTGPHGVEAPAVTGHDVPAREQDAAPPPDADQETTEQNLDRRQDKS